MKAGRRFGAESRGVVGPTNVKALPRARVALPHRVVGAALAVIVSDQYEVAAAGPALIVELDCERRLLPRHLSFFKIGEVVSQDQVGGNAVA